MLFAWVRDIGWIGKEEKKELTSVQRHSWLWGSEQSTLGYRGSSEITDGAGVMQFKNIWGFPFLCVFWTLMLYFFAAIIALNLNFFSFHCVPAMVTGGLPLLLQQSFIPTLKLIKMSQKNQVMCSRRLSRWLLWAELCLLPNPQYLRM